MRRKEDLHSFELPDFHRSGAAPLAHRMYSQIRGVVDHDFNVVFPEWDFGLFGMALNLRMVHLSPFTNLEESLEIIGNDHLIEIVLNPIDDVEKAPRVLHTS